MKDGDLIAASAATDSPITVSEGEDCTVNSQVNWADNGDVRNKSVVLKAKQGFYLTSETKFNVVGANSITAKWLYSTDGGQTCVVGVEAKECELITEAKGIVRGLVYYNRVNDIYVESYEPSKYSITVKEVSEYIRSSGSTTMTASCGRMSCSTRPAPPIISTAQSRQSRLCVPQRHRNAEICQ